MTTQTEEQHPLPGGILKPAVPGLNRLSVDRTTPEDEVLQLTHPEHPAPVPADILIQIDIESLALGPRPVITQIAMLGYDLNEDELMNPRYNEYLPIDPQLQIIPPRRIMGSTIAWWMKQSDEARALFELSTGTDFEDLAVIMRGFIRAFNQLTDNGRKNYEIQSKHPQFDIVAIETLLDELGLEKPWGHRTVTDLHTDLMRARINWKNIPTPEGYIAHTAYWDARHQIDMHLAAKRVFSNL